MLVKKKKYHVPVCVSFFFFFFQNTHGVHGAPLGSESLNKYKLDMGLDPEQTFLVDERVTNYYKETTASRGAEANANWDEMFKNVLYFFQEREKEIPPKLHKTFIFFYP